MENYTQRDLYVAGGGFLTVLVLAVASHVLKFPRIIEMIGDVITALLGIAAVYFIYKASDLLGGDMGRYISVMGLGIAYYSVTLIPHVYAHIQKMKIIPIFMFQHVMSIWAFGLIAWGLYLTWQGGKE